MGVSVMFYLRGHLRVKGDVRNHSELPRADDFLTQSISCRKIDHCSDRDRGNPGNLLDLPTARAPGRPGRRRELDKPGETVFGKMTHGCTLMHPNCKRETSVVRCALDAREKECFEVSREKTIGTDHAGTAGNGGPVVGR